MTDEKPPKDNRVPIMMSDTELAAIDNWRYANHVQSRSEAIRRLCQIALYVSDRLDDMPAKLAENLNAILKVVELTDEPPPTDSWQFKILDAGLRRGGLFSVVGELEELASVTRPFRTASSLTAALEEAARARIDALRHRDVMDGEADDA